ncbi:MAG: hypothetical protein M3P34_10400 [Actinomycetota bacterium]|nr:hypothetical protein [Actinomycetota bacterium]
MTDPLLRLYVWQLTLRSACGRASTRSERGEGVISTAIAVLIMAFLGVAVWAGFRMTLDNTQKKIDKNMEEIGN